MNKIMLPVTQGLNQALTWVFFSWQIPISAFFIYLFLNRAASSKTY